MYIKRINEKIKLDKQQLKISLNILNNDRMKWKDDYEKYNIMKSKMDINQRKRKRNALKTIKNILDSQLININKEICKLRDTD